MIQKFKLDLHLKHQASATEIQDKLVLLVKSKLVYGLDEIIKKKNIPENLHIRISRIEVDLGVISEHDIEHLFLSRFYERFSKILDTYLTPSSSDTKVDFSDVYLSELQAVKLFLQSGYFPWWYAHDKSVSALIEDLLHTRKSGFLAMLLEGDSRLKVLKLQRLAKQVSPEVLDKFAEELLVPLLEQIIGGSSEVSGSWWSRRRFIQKLLSAHYGSRLSFFEQQTPARTLARSISGKAAKQDAEAWARLAGQLLNKEFNLQALPEKEETVVGRGSITAVETGLFTAVEASAKYEADTKRNTEQRFALRLFPYTFLSDVWIAFMWLTTFPPWAAEFVARYKKAARLTTDFDVQQSLSKYLHSNYPGDYELLLASILENEEIAQIVSSAFPASLQQLLMVQRYGANANKLSRFEQLFLREITLKTPLYSEAWARELYLTTVFLYADTVSSWLVNMDVESDNFLNLIQEVADLPEQILPEDVLRSLLSELAGELPEAATAQLQEYLKEASVYEIKKFFETEFARKAFTLFLPQKISTLILERLFGNRYDEAQKIKREFLLVISGAKPVLFSDKLAYQLLQNSLLRMSLDYTQLPDSSEQVLYIISALSEQSGNTDFPERFAEALQRIIRQRVPLLMAALESNTGVLGKPNLASPFRYNLQRVQQFFSNLFSRKKETPSSSESLYSEITEDPERIAFQLVYYLQKGFLHWSAPYATPFELIQMFQRFRENVLTVWENEQYDVSENVPMVLRLQSLFTRTQAEEMYEALFGSSEATFNQILSNARKTNSEALHAMVDDQQIDLYDKLLQQKFDWVDTPVDNQKIYIKNAGLVLLCSFLPFLFTRTGLVQKKNGKNAFVDRAAQERAVHLTQFLATGSELAEEHELVLNKLICGLTVQEPVRKDIELTEIEKKEGEMMLKSVISHWKVLGATSIEGLRQTFLQRDGVVAFKNGAVNVKIEYKTVDILLQSLSWSYQTIKFSWNEHVILVDWNA